jgi:transposase
MEALKSMTQEELIDELVKARIREARLKKGYEVKGDGSVIRYVSKNIK